MLQTQTHKESVEIFTKKLKISPLSVSFSLLCHTSILNPETLWDAINQKCMNAEKMSTTKCE